jgi:hypothetical protein
MKKAESKADSAFRFFTRFHLTELLGMKASNLAELLSCIRSVPGSSIYHHTHRFLQQHLFLNPEPPNDFAFWVTEELGEEALGERLASIDTVQFTDIHTLREALVSTIESYLTVNPKSAQKFADPGEEFHLMQSRSFILPTRYEARTLSEFASALEAVTVDSIYFHVFESRLRLGKPSNDFSIWIAESMGNQNLADKISKIDPYTQTLEGLRRSLLISIKKG